MYRTALLTGYFAGGVLLALSGRAQAQTLPSYMDIVLNRDAALPARQIAEGNVLALNNIKFSIYSTTLQTYKKNIRANNPIILALFDGGGGQLILYPPGQPPETAPPASITYQLAKSAGHSAMAIYQIVAPYVEHPNQDAAWREPLMAYHRQMKLARDGAKDLDLSSDDREVIAGLLRNNVSFMERCLESNNYTFEQLNPSLTTKRH